ncbi:hypothetical protein D3C80_2206630 [compost metagenome]
MAEFFPLIKIKGILPRREMASSASTETVGMFLSTSIAVPPDCEMLETALKTNPSLVF